MGIEASPGNLNAPLTIYVQYLGTINLVSLIRTLYLPEGFIGGNGNSIISSYASAISAGSIVPFIFYISIDSGTPLSIYNVQFHVMGRTIYNTVIDQDFNVTIGKGDRGYKGYRL